MLWVGHVFVGIPSEFLVIYKSIVPSSSSSGEIMSAGIVSYSGLEYTCIFARVSLLSVSFWWRFWIFLQQEYICLNCWFLIFGDIPIPPPLYWIYMQDKFCQHATYISSLATYLYQHAIKWCTCPHNYFVWCMKGSDICHYTKHYIIICKLLWGIKMLTLVE